MKKILSFFMSIVLLLTLLPRLSFAENGELKETKTGTTKLGYGGICSCDYTCTLNETGSFECAFDEKCTCSRAAMEQTLWDKIKEVPGIVWDGVKWFFGSVWNVITWIPKNALNLLGKDFETIESSVNRFSFAEHLGNVAMLVVVVMMLSN